jgi:hypothetical protein
MDGFEEKGIMDTTFDRTVKTMARGACRRTVVRGLVAGLATAASGGIVTDSPAKKRRKKKRKKSLPTTPPTNPPTTSPTTPRPTCPQGALFAEVSVLADGSQSFTPVLEEGQVYVLSAYGYWSTNGDYMCDAFAAFLWKDPRSPLLYHNGVRLGLAVNGESPDLWGTYQQSHRYDLIVIGKGKPVSLQMLDSVYSDNDRHLYVDVFCGASND